jgi:quinolinate synthase
MNLKNYTEQQLIDYIKDAKGRLGSRLIIPAHHYIRRELVELADFTGDSYKLAVDVSRTDAEFIVFCGVRFMAESASILAKPGQHILLPDMDAGCPMADMIDEKTAEAAVNKISGICSREIAPLVYMNSYADSKSFCGRRGGAVCTSSNAEKLVKYYLERNKSIFFFPDYHLGRNVAEKLGIDKSLIVRVGRDLSLEEGKNLKDAKMFLWDGYCPVHQEFNTADVKSAREKYPDAKIIVHPESKHEVVELIDMSGSTQYIYDTIKKESEDSSWIIGTETTFVNRIAEEFSSMVIAPLKYSPCHDMLKISLLNTAMIISSIDSFLEGKGDMINEITVDDKLKTNARITLNRMIDIVEGREI